MNLRLIKDIKMLITGLILSVILEIVFPFSPVPTPETKQTESTIVKDSNHVTSTSAK